MNSIKRLATVGLLSAGVGLAACADTTSDDVVKNDDIRTGGLALTGTVEKSDVSEFEFSVQKVKCGDSSVTYGSPVVQNQGLEDLYLPGGISVFEKEPYDAESEHIFADAFFVLDAGPDDCYDATVTPKLTGDKAGACQPATKKQIQLEEGGTVEFLLISQCEGVDRGALDLIGTLNRPPEIMDVSWSNTKFLSTCRLEEEPEANQVCVTARDPDGDPLEWQWDAIDELGGPGFLGSIRSVGPPTVNPDGSETACAELTLGPIGDYGFRSTVYDLAWKDGVPVRIEQLLEEQEGFAIESRDFMSFPAYNQVDCQGRSAVLLMAMKNENNAGVRVDIGDALAHPFIRQTARWTSPKSIAQPTKVLHVLDDNDGGEQLSDVPYVKAQLDAEFGAGNVTQITEPMGGLTPALVAGYDVIWFQNPGYPLNDPASYTLLMDHLDDGGGLVIQGDDMAGPATAGPMEAFSYLSYQNNGVSTCGQTTNGNMGANYEVTFTMEPISILDGLRGLGGPYGNDIDHVAPAPLNLGVQILARATAPSIPGCQHDRPAAVAINPADLL